MGCSTCCCGFRSALDPPGKHQREAPTLPTSHTSVCVCVFLKKQPSTAQKLCEPSSRLLERGEIGDYIGDAQSLDCGSWEVSALRPRVGDLGFGGSGFRVSTYSRIGYLGFWY